jgi:hypothetical protein
MRKKLKLKKGEVLCNKCNGKGFFGRGRFPPVCPKCLGAGKLDWVENIVGKRRSAPQKLKVAWSFSESKNMKSLFASKILDEISSNMAEQMVKDIDKEIVEGLLKKKGAIDGFNI